MATAAGLTDISEFVVASHVIDRTVEVVQAAGAAGYEAFVLWGGVRSEQDDRLLIGSVYQPKQRSIASRDGLMVIVDGEALHRANQTFYEQGLVIAAQAHSHPAGAYHSDTDDEFPLMTLIGGLSVVIPFFGAGGREGMPEWAWYRLVDVGRWEPIGPATKVCIAE